MPLNNLLFGFFGLEHRCYLALSGQKPPPEVNFILRFELSHIFYTSCSHPNWPEMRFWAGNPRFALARVEVELRRLNEALFITFHSFLPFSPLVLRALFCRLN